MRLENLPAGAIGPGLLGTGGMYFFQAAGAFSYQFYLRELGPRVQRPDGADVVEAGRFSRGQRAGDRCPRGRYARPGMRTGRLLGDMPWSFYQRAWDGVRGGGARGRLSARDGGGATQGTYEESANLSIVVLRSPRSKCGRPWTPVAPHAGRPLRLHLRRPRAVTARPEPGSRRGAGDAVEAHVRTAGASRGGRVSPCRGGAWDTLRWAAVQTGHWYGQRHRAFAAAGQVGYQWTRVPWRPWLRAGVSYASGEPTPWTTRMARSFRCCRLATALALDAYAFMNVVDVWAEAQVTRAVDLTRRCLHRVRSRAVTTAGTGQRRDRARRELFRLPGTAVRGARDLGMIVEGDATWRPLRWWTLRAYAGRMAGGEVVRGLFADGAC